MILSESPRRKQVTRLVNWGHWFALANIIIALMISSIYLFSSASPGSAMGNGYMLANWMGHISFITFFGFVIFVLPWCYFIRSDKAVKVTGSIVAAIGIALLAFDALLYTRTGFHLSFSAAQLVRDEAQYRISQFGWQQWGYLLLLFLMWLGAQLVLANAIWLRLDKLAKYKVGTPLVAFFVTCFVSSHAVHVWADAQLYQPIIKQDNLFPLSYPATAKTTMSRYGLLDIARYQQRKQLQFSSSVGAIKYPSQPIYCSVTATKPVAVFIQMDAEQTDFLANFAQYKVAKYFSSASSNSSLITTSIFGIPEIYANQLQNQRPVLLALPHAQGLSVEVVGAEQHEHQHIASYLSANPPEQTNVSSDLSIVYADASELKSLVNEAIFASHNVLIATRSSNEHLGSIYSNLAIDTGIVSTEDIAPTVMHTLGCGAPPEQYSTGRNLLSSKRNWVVSTSGDKIVVLHQNQRIEVMSNGSYEIIDMRTNTRSNENLNVDLLSQAIKHLTRFSNGN